VARFERETVSEERIEETRRLIREGDDAGLRSLLDAMRPADVADLIEHLDPKERLFIFDILEPVGAGEVLVEIEPPVQEKLLEDLDNHSLSEIVQELDSDDAADLVGDLPVHRAQEIIRSVDDEVSRELVKLLPYPEDTAGGIMALEFVAIPAHATIQDAIETIREKREEVENLYYLWVVDERERLVGVVSIKDLLLEDPGRRVSEIMNPEVICVHVHEDQEEVARVVKKYDLVTVPVVDDDDRLVGRITHDDIIDVLEEEADEDFSLMAGVMPQEITEESPVKISRARLPWLMAGLFGELISALVISRFEVSLETILALTFFFPVIMAMGGSSGTQAATVAVRGLATGDISLVNIWKRIWVELRVALINGLICGILLGAVVSLWLSNYALGGVVALALVLIILNSGFIGAAVPLAFKRMDIDPALASGPFVTTSNDILGLLIYLGLVTLFLKITT